MSIKPPIKPLNINCDSQWLGGVGAGSWFSIEEHAKKYKIKRFSKEGKLEFAGIFKTKSEFNIELPYKFTYLSHYRFCTIIQDNHKIIFFLDE